VTTTFAAFTSTKSDSLCGAFTYECTYSDSTALDTNLFISFDSTNRELQTYSTDTSLANTYELTVKGY
jgi:hypothetical protein